MPGPRQLVSPPTFVDRPYGLLSVVQTRYDEPEAKWRNGVTWQDVCGTGGNTFDDYCVETPAPSGKAANFTVDTFGSMPFTVYGQVDCSPVGYSQSEQRARAVDALTRAEGFQVERTFWTGDVTGAGDTGGYVKPHLAADTATTDTSQGVVVTLQCAANIVTGTTVDIVEGLGRLEAAFGVCHPGQAVLHIPAVLGPALFEHYLAKVNGGKIETYTGHQVALGTGYTGSSPGGVLTPGVAWVYATSPVFAYRSPTETFTFVEQFDRAENTVKTIVERTYVLGYNCCCTYAIPISTGGDITGAYNSAT
jgi:hypothetical protein